MNTVFDVVVVGAGAAGLRAAVAATEAGASVAIVSSASVPNSSLAVSDYTACGDDLNNLGFTGPPDPPERLAADVLAESFGLAQEKRVYQFVENAGARLRELIEWGARPLARHSLRTVIIQGREIMAALNRQITKLPIKVCQQNVVQLLCDRDGLAGIEARNRAGIARSFRAKTVVLATGGYHGIYPFRTGAGPTTAIAHAWALQMGAELNDMEAVNFCPLVLAEGELRGSILPYVISQIARVCVRDLRDEDLMQIAVDQHGVTESREWDKLFLCLEMCARVESGLSAADGTFAFSLGTEICRDPRKLLVTLEALDFGNSIQNQTLIAKLLHGGSVKVAYAAHYSAGGIGVDETGATNVPGLFACGEAAGGLFGAFRAASSLTDCLVSGEIAGAAAARDSASHLHREIATTDLDIPSQFEGFESIRSIVGESLHPFRTRTGLESALVQLSDLRDQIHSVPKVNFLGPINDYLLIAECVALAANLRQDSCGFHVRRDTTSSAVAANTVLKLTDSVICAEMRAHFV